MQPLLGFRDGRAGGRKRRRSPAVGYWGTRTVAATGHTALANAHSLHANSHLDLPESAHPPQPAGQSTLDPTSDRPTADPRIAGCSIRSALPAPRLPDPNVPPSSLRSLPRKCSLMIAYLRGVKPRRSPSPGQDTDSPGRMDRPRRDCLGAPILSYGTPRPLEGVEEVWPVVVSSAVLVMPSGVLSATWRGEASQEAINRADDDSPG